MAALSAARLLHGRRRLPGRLLTMFRRHFKTGDLVVYRRLKTTTHPGPRARAVDASAHGDDYTYFVDKFWIVAEVLADRSLLLKTRRGKTHIVAQHDLNLRHASLWDRIRYRRRFNDLLQLLPKAE